ncbi:MAG: methyltransferase domain-containing protein [Methanomassiliicoccales archaeon]|nr:methyltransferase domain-containing protein [Methanomassiliicoccales archaeon]
MILDVGCGFGDLTVVLTDMGAKVCGLDITRSMIGVGMSRAKRFGSDADFTVGDAQSLPFSAGSFDIVVAMRAIHHFPDIPGFLKEVHRVLRLGGKAVFLEPQKSNPIVELNRRILRPDLHSKHEHALTMKDIRAARRIFPKMKTRVFYLVSPAAFLFDRVLRNKVLYEKSYKGLQKIEERASKISSLNRYYWQVLMELEKNAEVVREA